VLTVALLTGVVGVLCFAAGAAYGGRNAHQQSRRADAEKQRADKAERRATAAERAAGLAAMAAGETRRQLAEYVNARGTRAGRKAASHG